MTIPTEFTPGTALVGGMLIGVSAVLMMALFGRIAGISGIAVRVLPPWLDADVPGRLGFLLGLVAAPLTVLAITGALPVANFAASPVLLVAGGLLVGFGSIWGNGCTSGHGVCGLSRLSLRSLVATGTFMATAAATVLVFRHIL